MEPDTQCPDAGDVPGHCNPSAGGRAWALRAGLGLLLLLLVALRLAFLNSSPLEYPIERTAALAWQLTPRAQTPGLPGGAVLREGDGPAELPGNVRREAPLLLLAGLLPRPVTTARVINLLAALATGWALWRIGRSIGQSLNGPRSATAIGALALLAYAVSPLAIHAGRGLEPEAWGMALWCLALAGVLAPEAGQWRRRGWIGVGVLGAGLANPALTLLAPALLVAAWPGRELAAGGAPAGDPEDGRASRIHAEAAWLPAIAAGCYLLVCAWFRVAPWAPWTGSPGAETALAQGGGAWTALANAHGLRLAAARAALALTLPGALLALLGWALVRSATASAEGAPRRAAIWLHLWVIGGLGIVALTLSGPATQGYALTPCGCMLAAVGLVALARSSRAARNAGIWITLAAALGLLAWLDPTSAAIGRWRGGPAGAGWLDSLGRQVLKREHVIYLGPCPRALAWLTGAPGVGLRSAFDGQLDRLLRQKDMRWVLCDQALGAETVESLAARYPIAQQLPGRYLLVKTDLNARLGQPAEPPATRPVAVFEELLAALEVTVQPARVAPGRHFTVTITWERNPQTRAALSAAFGFIHEQTGEILPLTPLAMGWSRAEGGYPMLQLPDFVENTIETVSYPFIASEHLPPGAYDLRLGAAEGFTSARIGRGNIRVRLPLEIAPDARPPRVAPLAIAPERTLRSAADLEPRSGWRTRGAAAAGVLGADRLWMRPRLPAGDYLLRLRASASPAGAPGPERWPVVRALAISSPTSVSLMRFDAHRPLTREAMLRLAGPDDLVRLELANPYGQLGQPPAFAVFLESLNPGERRAAIERIEWLPAREARR